MLKYNGSILKLPSTAIVDYVPPSEYTRFMWRFDGVDGKEGGANFQMSAIKVNDISLPYTYVNSYLDGTVWSDSPATNFLDSNENNKWGGTGSSIQNMYGWIIFDLSTAVLPQSYSLKTANDTAGAGRRPQRSRLYASTGTPTTFDDASWILLDDRNPELPLSNLTWCGPYAVQS